MNCSEIYCSACIISIAISDQCNKSFLSRIYFSLVLSVSMLGEHKLSLMRAFDSEVTSQPQSYCGGEPSPSELGAPQTGAGDHSGKNLASE